MLSVSGCRGIFGVTMTPEVAARLALASAGFLREQRARAGVAGRPLVVLGRDGRAGGESLLLAAAGGLAAGGCDVIDVGVAMTPTCAIFTDVRGADAGIVLTASHNPQQWNGLKLIARRAGLGAGVVDACAPDKDLADRVIRRFRALMPAAGSIEGVHPLACDVPATLTGTVASASRGSGALGVPNEATVAHVQVLREALLAIGVHDDRAMMGLKCVVDSVNASGVAGARELLGPRLVAHLGSGASGLFPHAPEPLKENLGDLCKVVRDKRADAGFAQDPDADRLAIVDEQGSYIGEEYTLALAAESLLSIDPAKSRGAVLCTNLSTSRMIEDVAAKYAAHVVRSPVGEANVVEAMKREGAVLGGEGNGGVIWPRVTYIRDSLTAMALTLSLIARTGRPLSQLVASIPSYAILKRKVDLLDAAAAERAGEQVARHFASARVDRRDGVRVDFDDYARAGKAWVHVRASNTEPIMRLIAEAPSAAAAERLIDETQRAIAG